jgi:hypothetical protein
LFANKNHRTTHHTTMESKRANSNSELKLPRSSEGPHICP